MDLAVALLLLTFVVSIGALMVFVWSMSRGLFGAGTAAATEIFAAGEQGVAEDPALSADKGAQLRQAVAGPR